MTRDVLHTTLVRLTALAAIFLIAGALADVRAMAHDADHDQSPNGVHAEGMQDQNSECTGDGCGICDSTRGDDHFAEHCPDCLAQLPAAPETVRVDRRLNAADQAAPDVTSSDDAGCRKPSLSPSPARSGPASRSPILRL